MAPKASLTSSRGSWTPGRGLAMNGAHDLELGLSSTRQEYPGGRPGDSAGSAGRWRAPWLVMSLARASWSLAGMAWTLRHLVSSSATRGSAGVAVASNTWAHPG